MATFSSSNQVFLEGKLSRLARVKYTPAGFPVREATLAVRQSSLGKESVGYHELVFFKEVAEKDAEVLRIGQSIKVCGTLWSRSFRNRRGEKALETKVIVERWQLSSKAVPHVLKDELPRV